MNALLEHTVAEFMRPCPEAISMTASVQEAAERMSKDDSSWLPVRGSTGPVGVVSAGDIVRRSAACGEILADFPVSEIMTLGVVCCRSSDSVASALRLMKHHEIRQIGVIDSANRLSNVAYARDLIESYLTPELP